MITIQSAMLVILGFLCASLIVVLIAPAFWRRAVRLTSKRLKESLPFSETEIRAQKDRIRTEYAMRVHRLESQVKDAKLARARQKIEINRREASISGLETDLERLKASLEENQNARRVLEQTVADRLPKVERRLAEAKRQLFNRDREISDLNNSAKKQAQALAEAISINAQQAAQIDRLNMTLATRSSAKPRTGIREPGFEIELALRSELEALRAKSRDQAALIGRLQGQIGLGYGRDKSEAAYSGGKAGAQQMAEADSAEIQRLKRNLNETEKVLDAVATGGAAEAQLQKEMRQIKAKAQDQAGEIARLKAALATFEATGDAGEKVVVRESKIALKARLNAVRVQAEQQSHVIQQLRAELAAAHERTALQAQHFQTQMRRLGAGTMPAAGVSRAPRAADRSMSLAERISRPRAASQSEETAADKPSPPPLRQAPDKGSKAPAVDTPPLDPGEHNNAEDAATAAGQAGTGTEAARNSHTGTAMADHRGAESGPLDTQVSSDGEKSIGTIVSEGAVVSAKPPKPPPAQAHDAGASKQEQANGAVADDVPQQPAPETTAKKPRRKSRLLDRITNISKG